MSYVFSTAFELLWESINSAALWQVFWAVFPVWIFGAVVGLLVSRQLQSVRLHSVGDSLSGSPAPSSQMANWRHQNGSHLSGATRNGSASPRPCLSRGCYSQVGVVPRSRVEQVT
jgi:uncharacterized membrane protein YbhN (UPF0104 family)